MRLSIPDHLKSIGVLFSGGIDSTLLLYLIATQYPDRTIWAINAGSCGYIDWPIHTEYAKNVFDEINKRVEKGAIDYFLIHQLVDQKTHHCNKVMVEMPFIDCWAIGRNAAPPQNTIVASPNGELVNLYDSCPMPWRQNIIGDVWSRQNGQIVYTPFMYLTKQDEIKIFREQKIYDLIQFTRSCPKVWNKDEMSQFVPHCGECWWCLERQWGLNAN